jgi:hypothetical protein
MSPIMAKLAAVTVSGTGQNLLGLDVAGAYVDDVFIENTGSVQVDNVKIFERPYIGGAKAQLGATISSIAASGSGRVAVAQPVERLEAEGDKNVGGNTTVTISVTSGVQPSA